MKTELGKTGRCEFAQICLVPGVGCNRESKTGCSEWLRLDKFHKMPCPLFLDGEGGSRCDIPQYRAQMKDPDICMGAKSCPLQELRKIMPVRDFHEGVVYPSTFPPESTAREVVDRLRGIGY